MNMQIDMADHRDSHITPEQKLAQAIIWRAVLDSAGRLGGENLPAGQRTTVANQADSWLSGCGRDFRDVCDRAGIDPYFVRDKYVAGKINVDTLKHVTRRRVAE